MRFNEALLNPQAAWLIVDPDTKIDYGKIMTYKIWYSAKTLKPEITLIEDEFAKLTERKSK